MRASAPQGETSHPRSAVEHVTPYDRFALTDTEAGQLLRSGARRTELEAFFGPAEYHELAALAHRACAARLARDAARVLIVPGIMGSQLGLARRAPLPNDVLWLDPVDIGAGRLSALKVPDARAIRPYGVVLYSYLRLKLQLRAAGFDAVLYQYDWRLGIEALGRELAALLATESHPRVRLIGHSMGGLVCRAALAQPGTARIERVVLLGTPNLGSFAPVQALRGTYSVVRKIAQLDALNSAETLAGEIFSTFPSLYQMLPVPHDSESLDLFDAAQWPRSGPQPRADLLRAAARIQTQLAVPDERFSVVIGIGQETVTSVTRHRDDFLYTITREGDGTVPARRAELAGAGTWYAAVSHGELARDPIVAGAIADLLQSGTTQRLPNSWQGRGRARARISDRALRRRHTAKVDWADLSPEERRLFLQNLNEPPKLTLRVPARAPTRTGARRKGRTRRAR